jgi:hypothetical protein
MQSQTNDCHFLRRRMQQQRQMAQDKMTPLNETRVGFLPSTIMMMSRFAARMTSAECHASP